MKQLTVELCAGTACHLMGATDLLEALNGLRQQYPGLLQVKLTHCLGVCDKGPSVRIQGTVYSQLTVEKLQRLVTDSLGRRDEQ